MFGNNKLKAVTFSFDDGNIEDIRLIEIMNKYGLKGTFNLNSGRLTSVCGDWKNRHLNYYDIKGIYNGHEIACHGYTHPDFTQLDANTLYNEIMLDKKLLGFMFDREVCGMAYPYGCFNDTVVEALRECGIKYSRTVGSTLGFELPENPLLWNPTCHFICKDIDEIADKFLNCVAERPMLFYIWGHSYELVTEDDWQNFERFCERISGKDDVCYCSNIDVLNSMRQK